MPSMRQWISYLKIFLQAKTILLSINIFSFWNVVIYIKDMFRKLYGKFEINKTIAKTWNRNVSHKTIQKNSIFRQKSWKYILKTFTSYLRIVFFITVYYRLNKVSKSITLNNVFLLIEIKFYLIYIYIYNVGPKTLWKQLDFNINFTLFNIIHNFKN